MATRQQVPVVRDGIRQLPEAGARAAERLIGDRDAASREWRSGSA